MNQQRARRYFSGKERRHHQQEVNTMSPDSAARVAVAAGLHGEDAGPAAVFDSNCITPGTEFMETLQQCLAFFIQDRIVHSTAWAGVTVILSGSDVPGEGEHKILNFIRRGQQSTSLGDGTRLPRGLRHCLYGLDADLVMLGLASREHNVVLLREMNVRRNWPGQEDGQRQGPAATLVRHTGLELCYINLLREYFGHEFDAVDASTAPGGDAVSSGKAWDVERCVHDFVLLSMLVGNDFVPQLPGFEINEDGLDIVLQARACSG